MSGAASLERPPGAPVLCELSGRIEGDADRVFELLVELIDPRGESHFVVDRSSRRAVVQGDYWYRGEYRVDQVDAAADVEYIIVNVASGWRGLGALTGRRAVRAAPDAFEELMNHIRTALG